MCSEYHSMASRNKALGDNLYVLGRTPYVDYHLPNEQCSGVKYLSSRLDVILSLTFGVHSAF